VLAVGVALGDDTVGLFEHFRRGVNARVVELAGEDLDWAALRGRVVGLEALSNSLFIHLLQVIPLVARPTVLPSIHSTLRALLYPSYSSSLRQYCDCSSRIIPLSISLVVLPD